MPGSIDLGEQLEGFITQAVKSGRYGSRGDLIREGVRLIQEREQRLAKLDEALLKGIAAAEAGRVTDAELVFDRMIRKYEAMAAKSVA
jgi:antitoxin ParD1/3/4